MLLAIVFATLVALCHAGNLNRFHSGDCPTLKYPTMPNFDIDKFLGIWFVIENYNDNNLACLTEHFSVEEANHTDHVDTIKQEMKIKEKRDAAGEDIEKEVTSIYCVKRSHLPFGGRHFVSDTGSIKFLSAESESEMEIGYPYTETGMLNLKHYRVVATDYTSYALVWRCQSTIFGHRRTAQIMSRKRTLSNDILAEIRGLIKLIDEDSDASFQPVRQTECNESPTPVQHNETESKPSTARPEKPTNDNKFEITKVIHISRDKNKEKEKKKLLSIDVGGFHLSISFPFW